MGHVIRGKAKLLNRLRRLRGQIDAVERAIGADEGCTEVLHRVAAARGAISALMSEVLELHLRRHVLTSTARANIKAADELIEVVKTYLH
ncbi:MAG TPA: metal-sensing transcriptional repressor [Verrucomicrobiae bacterium]|nr:metal-sensing transcriptional repressor [Verrucomicrobiae bacterium]